MTVTTPTHPPEAIGRESRRANSTLTGGVPRPHPSGPYERPGDRRDDSLSALTAQHALLPCAHVTVHNTWNTIGMRATASNDYEVSNCPVPANWVYDAFGPMRRPDEPLYRLPWWFLVKHAGVLTALARRAIDAAIGATTTKMVFPEGVLLIDRPGTLEAIAHAESATRAAQAFLVAEIERVWAACVDDGDLSRSVTGPLRLAMVHASTVAVDVTRAMFDLLTTTSIATGSVFAQLVADAP